ncbi:BAR-domain-containing protein [Armillaria novae-zelandiae]|uniref:BAR-domain-containing protein n=1 Tax=Armillaria novae-zelandiae TaxID=153914 RepID=A0AA39UL80_9AGAR|nr:BAR-domain-containing protein [Armillaria novae-zelandiae]
MDGTKVTKRRKITDKTLPNVVLQNPEFAQDSRMYQDLLEMERKLDWTMTRKKVEIQDSLARNPTTTRTLRLFLSHTVSSQIWQTGGEQMANFETGEGIPAWSFKIEGRLLEVGNQRSKDKAPTRKFSTFIKKMIVELDRDPSLYPEGNIVEWPRATGLQNPVLDGFTVRRTGDAAVKLRIILYPDHYPEQYKVSPELGDILGIKEESRVGVIQTLWNYIKLHGLQDKVDRRLVRADEKLALIFRAESIAFQKLPDVVNQYLSTPEPVVLRYTIDPSVPPPDRPAAWDIEVKAEDVFLKNRMSVMLQTNRESAQNLVKLDEEITLHAQSLHNSHLKRTFLESFAKNPAEFIQTWLESQSRDLETILGSGPTEGLTVRQEELRRSEFFKLPWVEELGKLRQWAGEVISSREKTTVTEEFHELELDIEKRKLAAQKLYLASEDYHHALSKKKESESLENPEKLLPIDTLGVVMIVHGEEYGEDSALGTSLVKLGRAHCKIATLQEAYALTFRDTYIASLESFGNEVKEYEHQRKKLESRRLSLDAALTKQEKLKNSKKEKDKVEADEEVERAQARYDEAAEDVRAYMHAIQENEIDQLRELTGFLESEVNFVKQYLEVLQETQAEWSNTSDVIPRRAEGPMHTFSRSNSTKTPKRPVQKRTWSSRSNPQSTPADSSDDEQTKASSSSRRPSSAHRRTDSAGTAKGSSRPPSRPSSRASRKRSDSLANPDSSMKMSVAGWANSAVSSVRGKKKEKFASLQDDDNDHPQGSEGNSPVSLSPSFTKALRRKSQTNEGPPKESSRILKPPSLQDKKVVRALYDFNGSSDELTFKAGDEIVVINEVLDGWWMGLLAGKQGLFPTPYTEAVSKKPVLLKRSRSGKAYEEDTAYIAPSFQSDDDSPDEGYRTSDLEEEDAYKSKPLNPSHSPFFGGPPDHGLSNTVDDDEDHLMPSISRHGLSDIGPSLTAEPTPPVLPLRRASTTDVLATLTPGKKAPPPPPPRRSATPSMTPKIPPRRPSVPASSSSSSLLTPQNTETPSPKSSFGYDASPFDSVSDLSLPSTTTCKEFKQNPFKPKGMCSNCFEQHA